jgi:hypothetical protein
MTKSAISLVAIDMPLSTGADHFSSGVGPCDQCRLFFAMVFDSYAERRPPR